MKQITMLEMIDHLEKTIELLKDAVRQTDYKLLPEAADEPEAEAVMCGHKNPTNVFSDCVCVRPEGHEGKHGCTPDGTICEWSNEIEADLSPETETPPVKVGDRVRVIARLSGHGFMIAQTIIVDEVTSNITVNEIRGKSLGGGEEWYLRKGEYELIPETQPTPKPEGMTVQELIDKLNTVEDKTLTVIVSASTISDDTLKQIAFDTKERELYLRDWEYTGTGLPRL
jgi:hypothetical protein